MLAANKVHNHIGNQAQDNSIGDGIRQRHHKHTNECWDSFCKIIEWNMLGLIAYVVMNLVCGKYKKLSIAMYILAVLFILKLIFIS